MDDDLTRKLIERMRTVKWMLHAETSMVDGVKREVVAQGEVIELAAYGHRLEVAYANEDTDEAYHLLAAIL